MNGEKREANKKKKREDLPVDRLESSPLPPTLEEAEAEYFADMAFDDRLLTLLENETPTILTHISHRTTKHWEGLAARYFKTNSSEEHEFVIDDDHVEVLPEDAFAYSLFGTIQNNIQGLKVDITIMPEDMSENRVRIMSAEDRPDTYYLNNSELEFDLIDTDQLFILLCQLGGVNKKQVDSFVDSFHALHPTNQRLMRDHVEDLWSQLAETYGKKETVYTIEHEVTPPQPSNNLETIRLMRKEIEVPESSQIELFLERSNFNPDLDVEESYRLRLLFEQVDHGTVEKSAERIVASGAPVKLIGYEVSKKSHGKVSKLDLDDIYVKGLFVDWFDQLVSD